MTVQSHDYSERPFGAWDTEDTMADEREAAITRLMRPSVGATSRAQAEVLVDEIGVDTIRSESDELLADRVANPQSPVAAPDQAVIAEVLAEVGDDPVKAQVALDAERAGKARVTLISALEAKVSTPAGSAAGNPSTQVGVDSGSEAFSLAPEQTPQGGQGGVPNDVTSAPGDDGAPVEGAVAAQNGPNVDEQPDTA